MGIYLDPLHHEEELRPLRRADPAQIMTCWGWSLLRTYLLCSGMVSNEGPYTLLFWGLCFTWMLEIFSSVKSTLLTSWRSCRARRALRRGTLVANADAGASGTLRFQ